VLAGLLDRERLDVYFVGSVQRGERQAVVNPWHAVICQARFTAEHTDMLVEFWRISKEKARCPLA
jgi:hypothetical protein